MKRKLKTLLLAAFAITALGTIAANSASAHKAAERFTNVTSSSSTVVTTEPDGVSGSSTAHQVFDVPGNGALTCKDVELVGTIGAELEPTGLLMGEEGNGPTGCMFLGQAATAKMEGCKAKYANGGSITGCGGKEMTFTAGACAIKIPEQGPFKESGKFENLGTGGNEMYITAEFATGAEVKGTASGAGCLTPGAFTTGQYTTGNTLIKGWSDPKSTQKPLTVDF